jgi:hypothetical protein
MNILHYCQELYNEYSVHIDKKDQPKSVIMLSISDRSERLCISISIGQTSKKYVKVDQQEAINKIKDILE